MLVGCVIRNIDRCESRVDVEPRDFVGDAEDSGDAGDRRVIVLEALNGRGDGLSGCDRVGEDQDVLVADRHLHVVAEDDLVVGGVLRRDDIDGLVRVVADDSRLAEMLGEEGADDFCPVQTHDRVHGRRTRVHRCQQIGDVFGLIAAGLHGRDIHIARDVGVRGREMSVDDLQCDVGIPLGGDLDVLFLHISIAPFVIPCS